MKRFVALCLAALVLLSVLVGCDSGDAIDTSELEHLSRYEMPEASFWRDADGKYYIYIKEWQEYRQLEGLEDYAEDYVRIQNTSIVINETSGAIAVFIQPGKDDTEVITYHFNKSNDDVQAYSDILGTDASGEPQFFRLNLFSEDRGFFIHVTRDIAADDGSGTIWCPIIRYETTDGGKTWCKAEVYDFVDGDWHKSPQFAKFVSKEVGVVCFQNDIFGTTVLTKDGGLTWYEISNVPKRYDIQECEFIVHEEIYDFEKRGDEYILVKELLVMPTGGYSFNTYVYYKSSDLIHWKFCKP